MEQQIRFCTSADGTRLAYATVGDGPPLVVLATWATNWELLLEEPAGCAWLESIGRGRRLIMLDRRGVGASQREVEDLSLEAHVADVAAIVEHLQLERFDLLGYADGAAVCVAYVVRHPERVSRLVLYAAYARGEELAPPEALLSQMELIRGNWPLARPALVALVYPSGPPEIQQWYAEQVRRALSPEMAARYVEFTMGLDISSLLPQVQTPSLVLTSHRTKIVPFGASRAVAALIPDARVVTLETGRGLLVDHPQVTRLVRQFLDEDRKQDTVVEPAPSGLVTILFTDIESSTALTQRLGDAKAQDLLRTHNTIVRDALKTQRGSEIKHTGDGIMASFPSASGALECAIAIQRTVAALRQAQGGPLRQAQDGDAGPTPDQAEPVEASLRVRIGLNAGEPVAEEHPDGQADLFGTAVQLARRVCDHAEPAQVLASDVVRQLAAGKGFLFSDIGETELRGFEDPVRLYQVRWRESTGAQ